MTNEFTMDFRLIVFHPPMKPQAGQFTLRKDESLIAIGVSPMAGGYVNEDLAGSSEIVPITQKDAAIQRVVLAAVQSVLRQNEERKTKLE